MAGLLELLTKVASVPGRAAAAIGEPILHSRGRVLQELEEARQKADSERQAELLKPLLNRYGPDAAKAIGSAWMAGGPAAQVATERLQALQQRQDVQQGVVGPEPVSLPGQLFSNFTPESIGQYQQTGNPAVLQYRPDFLAQARINLAREREDRMRMQSGRLPLGQMETMINEEAIDAGLDAAAVAMKPEYFGYGFDAVGEAAKEYKARTGTDTDFTGFWNEMDTGQAERRYELFGATLTDNELAEWRRIAISPKDSYAAAAAKLSAQKRLVARKRQVRRQMLQQGGYNVPGQRPPLSEFDDGL
jgi:hypothetical protein